MIFNLEDVRTRLLSPAEAMLWLLDKVELAPKQEVQIKKIKYKCRGSGSAGSFQLSPVFVSAKNYTDPTHHCLLPIYY